MVALFQAPVEGYAGPLAVMQPFGPLVSSGAPPITSLGGEGLNLLPELYLA